MKLKLLTALLVIAVLAGAVYYYQSLTPQNLNMASSSETFGKNAAPFPNVAFTGPDGKNFRLGDLKEKIVLVHFWAAWCAVCHTEFPDLVKYVEKSNGKIALIAISLDDNYEDSRKVIEKIGIAGTPPHFYWAWDKDKSISLHAFNTVKVPETIIVENGKMQEKIIGVGPWADASSKP